MPTSVSQTTPAEVDTTTRVPIAELNHYHRNARKGDVPAIARSLFKLKQYKPITVNIGALTGRPNEVLAGNHTLMAVRLLNEQHPDDETWQTIKCHWGEWDDNDARLINLADNRTADLGEYDNDILLGELTEVGTDDLAAISYTQNDLDALMPQEPGRGDGAKLALWGSTVGEPEVAVEPGSIWQMGHHTVIAVSLHKAWQSWVPLLKEGMLFAPYPSLLLPYTDIARETPMLMVCPDVFIAGWMLTKWNRIMPESPAVQQ